MESYEKGGSVSGLSPEPRVYQMIEKCHSLIDCIGGITMMLRQDTPEKAREAIKSANPLEEKLEILVSHLKDLLESYNV